MNISKTLIDKILIITSLIAALDSNSIHIMIRIRNKFTNSKDSTDLNAITPKNLNKNLLNQLLLKWIKILSQPLLWKSNDPSSFIYY